MLSIDEQIQQAREKVAKLERQKKVQLRKEQQAQRKKEQRRNYIIGELVSQYFPEVRVFNPGNKAENTVIFNPLESFLSVLAANQEILNMIKEDAANHKYTDGRKD